MSNELQNVLEQKNFYGASLEPGGSALLAEKMFSLISNQISEPVYQTQWRCAGLANGFILWAPVNASIVLMDTPQGWTPFCVASAETEALPNATVLPRSQTREIPMWEGKRHWTVKRKINWLETQIGKSIYQQKSQAKIRYLYKQLARLQQVQQLQASNAKSTDTTAEK